MLNAQFRPIGSHQARLPEVKHVPRIGQPVAAPQKLSASLPEQHLEAARGLCVTHGNHFDRLGEASPYVAVVVTLHRTLQLVEGEHTAFAM